MSIERNYNIKEDDFSSDRSNYLESNKNENFELIEELTKVNNKIKLWTILFWAGWLFLPILNFGFLIARSFAKTKAEEIHLKLGHNSIKRDTKI